MARFAESADVTRANGGTAAGSQADVEHDLDVASARLRRLIPSLEARVADDEDLALLARDTVAEAVLRQVRYRQQGGPEVQAMTQSAGPFSTTMNFRGSRQVFFTAEELDLLREGVATLTGVGTINIGRPIDWFGQ